LPVGQAFSYPSSSYDCITLEVGTEWQKFKFGSCFLQCSNYMSLLTWYCALFQIHFIVKTWGWWNDVVENGDFYDYFIFLDELHIFFSCLVFDSYPEILNLCICLNGGCPYGKTYFCSLRWFINRCIKFSQLHMSHVTLIS